MKKLYSSLVLWFREDNHWERVRFFFVLGAVIALTHISTPPLSQAIFLIIGAIILAGLLPPKS